MTLAHLGRPDAAAAIAAATEPVPADGRDLTPDMGGRATTEALGRRVAAEI